MRVAVSWLGVVLSIASAVCAQEDASETAARVRAGGWFEPTKFQRGADGALESWYFADFGGPASKGRFTSLVGGNANEVPVGNLGALGLLALVCHGPGDLLSMTDADFHFQALGVGSDSVALRQFVVVPFASEGPLGRAALLDRQLAVATLLRRGDRGAIAELIALVHQGSLQAALLESTKRALASHEGTTAAPRRRRFDAATLLLPAAFDGCVVIDHARLPDMSWLTPLGRRIGALVTAYSVRDAGGSVTESQCNGAQRMCDQVSEAPFEYVRRFGNARLDQSCVVVTAKADRRMPFAITWQAAGEFEADGWKNAKLPAGEARNNPLLGGALTVEAERLVASTDGKLGIVRQAKAEELLADTGCAVRAIVPGSSKLWPALAFLGLPAAQAAELRMTFGDPAMLTLVIEARDDDAAAAWVAKGKDLIEQGKAALVPVPAPSSTNPLELSKELRDLLAACLEAKLSAKANVVTASIEIRGFTSAKLGAIVAVLVMG